MRADCEREREEVDRAELVEERIDPVQDADEHVRAPSLLLAVGVRRQERIPVVGRRHEGLLDGAW